MVFLPGIALLGLEVFVFPIAASLWMGAPVAGAITYFWFLVRLGADIKDPLSGYLLLGQYDDFITAIKYYGLYYVLLIALGTLTGWFVRLVMDLRDPIALHTLLPSFETHNIDSIVATPSNPDPLLTQALLRDYYCYCMGQEKKTKGCFTHVETNYWFVIVGVMLALLTLFAPHMLFWGLLSINKWIALFLPIGLLIAGYLLFWLYHSYRTDLGTWGASKYNMAERLESIRKEDENSIYAEDPDITGFADALYQQTQSLVNKNTLVRALIHIAGFLLIGGLIAIPESPDLDIVWPVGLVFLIAVLFIFALIAFVAYYNRRDQVPMCPSNSTNGSKQNSPFSLKTFKQNKLDSKKSDDDAVVLNNKNNSSNLRSNKSKAIEW